MRKQGRSSKQTTGLSKSWGWRYNQSSCSICAKNALFIGPRHLVFLGHPVLQEINFREGDTDFATQIAVIKQADPEAVVFWGNPAETGPAARRLREAGVKAAFFGFDRVVGQWGTDGVEGPG